VDFGLNDGAMRGMDSPIRRSFERLLRRLLTWPRRPAVLLLQNFNGFDPVRTPGSQCVPSEPVSANRTCGVHRALWLTLHEGMAGRIVSS
jgi:hypothetical protein